MACRNPICLQEGSNSRKCNRETLQGATLRRRVAHRSELCTEAQMQATLASGRAGGTGFVLRRLRRRFSGVASPLAGKQPGASQT